MKFHENPLSGSVIVVCIHEDKRMADGAWVGEYSKVLKAKTCKMYEILKKRRITTINVSAGYFFTHYRA
jgi:hypothetical protein